ncbi:hypothetical protein [Pseudoduganella rhizocola]|uniref:hypothetical protein n=1 Tax=Pseudoduganella rhizocola TaxID=3382643 RepID=UPI0038B41D00
MKSLFLLPLLLMLAGAANASTLRTPSFVVEIKSKCAEGNVTCDDVIYTGTSKKTGKSIRLRGKTLHTWKNGVPGRFLGYEFRNGKTHYQVLEDGNLIVRLGTKVILSEHGEWDK